jgi:hypothetical protein
MRFVPSDFEHAAKAALKPEMTLSGRLGLWWAVVTPHDHPCSAPGTLSPGFYVSAHTEAELCRRFDRLSLKVAEAELGHVRAYCDICSPKSPLLERSGLLRLMADARTGRVALAAAEALFSDEVVRFRSMGTTVSIDWMALWTSGKPPSSKVSYLALFAGAMLTEIYCGRTNERKQPDDYTLLLLKAFRLVSRDIDLPEILAQLRRRRIDDCRIKDFFELFSKDPAVSKKTTGRTCIVRDIEAGRTLRVGRS